MLATGTLATAEGSTTPGPSTTSSHPTHQQSWKRQLTQALPSLGHRNWIVVADSAYPQQTSAGVTTIVTNAGQAQVVRDVVALLDQQKHVKPHVQVDKELSYVPEKSAPGITSYRADLKKILGSQEVKPVLHADLISKLDTAGKQFNVIVLKTTMTLPYTSVFFELDAKYWDPQRETELRKLMEQGQ
ncbi:hypothetical protein VV02_05340 [Luteipulveratus mongoliensis]|uniref:D-ribose pyranase n=1 Tax=Luteipulveratus mongoliensis TaxID=571913 RepID=A0A0K1JPL8_9MICO|nr:hypothetical protein VV02_05340 [Luteipulveratus mongoliensis]